MFINIKIRAEVCGDFGVHPSISSPWRTVKWRYTVTHIPTGHAACLVGSREIAMDIASLMNDVGVIMKGKLATRSSLRELAMKVESKYEEGQDFVFCAGNEAPTTD